MRNSFIALLGLTLILTGCGRSAPEKKEEPAAEKGPALMEMTLEAQNHVGLQVAPAQVKNLVEHLQVTGTVQAIDSRIGHVRPLARGRVQEVLAQVGDRVGAGQALARMDNMEGGELISQYRAGQADLQKLKVQFAVASKQAERYRRLLAIGATPEKEYETSRAEQQALEESIRAQESVLGGLAARLDRFGIRTDAAPNASITTIRSPFSGVVIKTAVALGAVVNADSELFQVADLSQVWVQAEVYEKDLGRIRAGQQASITVDTYADAVFSGKVTHIGDILDPKTRTARVRCEVPNPGIKLKLDMFASVSLPTIFSRTAIAVPAAAIQQLDGKNVVFVRKSETKFETRQVQTGKTVDGNVEIVSGLKQGESVVINGAFHLKSIAMGKQIGEEE